MKTFTPVPLTRLALLSVMFWLSSCTTTSKTVYFNGVPNGPIASTMSIPESIIQKNDILSIVVSDLNPTAAAIFNPTSPDNKNPVATVSKEVDGYLVDTDGNIQFPLLGIIKAEGLTKNQLKDKIKNLSKSKGLLLDPIVTIRFLNFKVTVLGEVGRPTVIPIANEKISLLEALGLAGDLTIYGNRQNVMVIREEVVPGKPDQQRSIARLNLNSGELFTSPYYYLQSNDIVYVEPNKAKISSTSRAGQWLPVIFSGLSLAAIVADRLIK
ncbi:MAG: polysaccharide biosynthesis/export family protein [Chitinophagaceae bacterium]